METNEMKKTDKQTEIGMITREDEEYPERLLELGDSAPETLYYEGNLSLLSKPCAAVVGARKASSYGLWAAYNSGRTLAGAGIVTVSGLAAGCDASAHRGALEGGGRTIAVMGCGLDICYPAANRQLWRRIRAEGLLLSEYPPGTPAFRGNFPRRNRIISGISSEVVVAEAGISSGSLITAECAVEQGKNVLAFPGNITAVSSMGCNKLIADGSGIVTGLADLVTAMGMEPGVESFKPGRKLSPLEQKVYDTVCREGEITADRICSLTGLDIARINAAVAILEVRGFLCSMMGKIFIAKQL